MEEEQPLIGSANLSTSSSVDPNQNQTKKKKKGYGFAAFLLALLLSAAFITVQYIAGSDSGINRNSNSNNLMDGSASLTLSTNEGSSQQERGFCLEDGNYTDVVPYKHHKKVLPGAIYNGLDFTDDSFKGSIKYKDCFKSWESQTCEDFGDGKPLGYCPQHGDYACLRPQTHIVEGWKLCAKYCNDDPDCYTFTLHTQVSAIFTIR